MVKVSAAEDCGNAPKKQFVKDFLIASAQADFKAVAEMLRDDANLEIINYVTVSGKDTVIKQLQADAAQGAVEELVIHNILSHGDRCAANGVLKFKDGSRVAFCNMYVFNSHARDARLKEITVYSLVLA